MQLTEKIKLAAATVAYHELVNSSFEKNAKVSDFFKNLWEALKGAGKGVGKGIGSAAKYTWQHPGLRIPLGAGLGAAATLPFTGDEDTMKRLEIALAGGAGGAGLAAIPELVSYLKRGGGLGADIADVRQNALVKALGGRPRNQFLPKEILDKVLRVENAKNSRFALGALFGNTGTRIPLTTLLGGGLGAGAGALLGEDALETGLIGAGAGALGGVTPNIISGLKRLAQAKA